MAVQDVQLDGLDAKMLALLDAEPRIGVLELSRRLAVARGTVQGRRAQLIARGALRGVTSFVTLEISQRYGHTAVATHLADIPEVLEAHTITGSGDVFCRIVARSNADLQRVIDQIVGYEGIVRASTIIALAELIPYRVMPLVATAATKAS